MTSVALLSLWEILVYVCVFLVLWKVARWVWKALHRDYDRREIILNLNGIHYPCSYWAEKGLRPYMEDRFQVCRGRDADDSSCYGVFDGHGGHQAAQFCQDNLLKFAIADSKFAAQPQEALKSAFITTEEKFLELARQKGYADGTTAVVAAIHSRKIYVANAGDSRAIVVQRGGRVLPMSDDHKPSRPDEKKRVEDAGGKVVFWGRWRVEGVLAVSRAIGDVNLKPYVICDPELSSKSIEEDDMFLVLASDGIWDVMSNEQVARLVLQAREFKFAARDLCQEATLLGSTDNVTALCIALKPEKVLEESNGHS